MMPTTSGPNAAPSDPVPSMMAVTMALAFWLDFRVGWVPYTHYSIPAISQKEEGKKSCLPHFFEKYILSFPLS